VLLARHLRADTDAHVEVWSLSSSGVAAELCADYSIPWRVVRLSWNSGRRQQVGSMLRLLAALRQFRPDAILPYTLLPNVLCGCLWRMAGARTCIWNQRDVVDWHVGLTAERLALRQVPLFVSNSGHASKYLAERLRVPIERIRVIRNGVELPPKVHDRSEWRMRFGARPDAFVACMLANLSPLKDHATLLHAWRRVIDCLDIPAHLVLAGNAQGTETAVKELVRNLGIQGRVTFLGPVHDVAGLLAAIDVSVLSSASEGCPNGLLESMAAGLPVVGSDIPGVREAVGRAGARFLSPVRDDEGLAKSLVALARSPAMRVEAGVRNAARIDRHFSTSRMVGQTAALLTEALQ